MNKTIKSFLDKPMDRKDFLKHLGVGALFISGGGMIVNALRLQEQVASQQSPSVASMRAYGTSAYGGGRSTS